MSKKIIKSIFLKLLLILIFILIIETILIFIGYKKNGINTNSFKIKDYNSKKTIVILIDFCDNTLNILQDGNIMKIYTIASKKTSNHSPIGSWTIINSCTWWKCFEERFLGLNVLCEKHGIHDTTHPNSIGWVSCQLIQ